MNYSSVLVKNIKAVLTVCSFRQEPSNTTTTTEL